MNRTGPIQVLLLSHRFSPDIGGIETMSQLMAEALSSAGMKVCVATWTKKDSQAQRCYDVERNPSAKTLLRLHQWCHIVIENNPCIRLGWPAMFTNKPVLVIVHTWVSRTDGSLSLRDKLKMKWWLGRATHVVAVSKVLQQQCWPEATVIENCYRSDLFRVVPEIEKSIPFVFLGRLVPDKGVALLIEAIGNLRRRMQLPSGILLTIVGTGPEQGALEEQVQQLQLTGSILFVGAVTGDSLTRLLNQHRFIVIPSLWEEPFGLIALEGMACGCVPLVANSGSLPSIIGNAGKIFQRNSQEGLTTLLQQALNNTIQEQTLRNRAHTRLQYYHPDFILKRYIHLIDGLVTNNQHEPSFLPSNR